jgi:hypothetical protein
MRIAVDLRGRDAGQLQQLRSNGAQLTFLSRVPGVEQAQRRNSEDRAAGKNAMQQRSIDALEYTFRFHALLPWPSRGQADPYPCIGRRAAGFRWA